MYSRNIVRPWESITVAKSRSFLSASKGYAVTSLSLSLSLSLSRCCCLDKVLVSSLDNRVRPIC